MGGWMDRVAKLLASGMPRRRALQSLGGGVVGAVGAALLQDEAQAQIICNSPGQVCRQQGRDTQTCCPPANTCVLSSGACICCATGNTCCGTQTPPPGGGTGTTGQTRLLYPFVTSQAGFDTGISLSNTTQDPFGTTPQAGTCTFHYFGRLGNGNPPARTSETTNRDVAAGETITMVLSTGGGLGLQGNANFQGYMIVVCNFPLAHGFAFITDGPIGQARVAEGYLARVIESTRTAPEGLGA